MRSDSYPHQWGTCRRPVISAGEKAGNYFPLLFGDYTQQEIGEMYGRCRSTAWHHIHSALQMLHKEMEVLFREES